MERRYYAAYGSNINIKQMRMRCPSVKIVGTSEIPNYQLLFKGCKTSSYLTIEPKEGKCVPVVIWAVTKKDELLLDKYECFPKFYYKKDLKLLVDLFNSDEKRRLDTFAYVMHKDRSIGLPTKIYIEKCLEGYRTFGFKEDILKKAVYESELRLR